MMQVLCILENILKIEQHPKLSVVKLCEKDFFFLILHVDVLHRDWAIV